MSYHPPRKSRKGPIHDLAEIQRRVAGGDFHPSTTTAVDPVVREYACNKRKAREILQSIVATLSDADYADSLEMYGGVLADEYGKMFENVGWYVKFTFNVQDDEVDVISCHLTKKPLKTKSQTIAAFDPPQFP